MVLVQSTFDGRVALEAAQDVKPLFTLTGYAHALVLRKDDEHGGTVEYPIDPSELAQALAAKSSFSSGLLTPRTVAVLQNGARRRVIEYRRPQITGLWLEGSDEALRVPLPPLLMVRDTQSNRSPAYQVYAVKRRPRSSKEPLFFAPLPHVRGSVCWGTVAQPSARSLAGTSLSEDWRQFLGSRFGNHSVDGKSKSHQGDIRSLYFALTGKAQYPLDDLVPFERAERTLASILKL